MTPLLKRGDTDATKSGYVSILQNALKSLGYNIGYYGADGQFGVSTEAAVKNFQRDFGLAADGIVGARTWAEIERSLGTGAAGPHLVEIPNLTRDEVMLLYNALRGVITQFQGPDVGVNSVFKAQIPNLSAADANLVRKMLLTSVVKPQV